MFLPFARFLLSLTLGASVAAFPSTAGPREIAWNPAPAQRQQLTDQPALRDTTDTAALAEQAFGAPMDADGAQQAALTLATRAAARHDDAAELRWRTMVLLTSVQDRGGADRDSIYAQLVPLYARVLAHGPAPDIKPGVLVPRSASQPPLDLDHYIDRQWFVLYDRSTPGLPAADTPRVGAPGSTRLVVGEYITAIDCPTCVHEDLAERAAMRHFGEDRYIVLATHYFQNDPPSIWPEQLFPRLLAWYPTNATDVPKPPVIPNTGVSRWPGPGHGWIGVFVDGHQLSLGPETQVFHEVMETVAAELRRAPAAAVHVGVRTHGDTIVTQVQVASIRGTHARLALRIALIEDTVRVLGDTPRRIHLNVVRAAAQSPKLPLGLPLAGTGGSNLTYTFNLATLQAELSAQRDSIMQENNIQPQERMLMQNTRFDARNWHIDPAHLQVVAFVQDLGTGEVLQAARVRVYGTQAPAAASR